MRTFGRKTYANELSWLAFLRCSLPVKARRCREIHSQRIILSSASGVLDFGRTLSLYTVLYSVIVLSACNFYTVKDWKRKRWRQVGGLQGAQLFAHFLKDTRAQDHPLCDGTCWRKNNVSINWLEFGSDWTARFAPHRTDSKTRKLSTSRLSSYPWSVWSAARLEPWILILTERVFKRYQMVFLWDAKYGKSVSQLCVTAVSRVYFYASRFIVSECS